MIERKCDICGKVVPYIRRRRLNFSAIRDITGAENVCDTCLEKIQKTDWNAVVRRELKTVVDKEDGEEG